MALDVSKIYHEIYFTVSRSSGPGGQNVNKVNSAATLHWDIQNSTSPNEEQRQMLFAKISKHINKDGTLYIRSDELRDLDGNKKNCIKKLTLLILFAFKKQKRRKQTKPSLASKRKRLDGKKRRGDIKGNRKKISY